MLAEEPKYIVVVDQGSRAAPPVVDSPETKSLILDHHMTDEFPNNAMVLKVCSARDRGSTDNKRLSL